jgi:hypothetical protein
MIYFLSFPRELCYICPSNISDIVVVVVVVVVLRAFCKVVRSRKCRYNYSTVKSSEMRHEIETVPARHKINAPKEETNSCNVKETHALSVDGKRQQDRQKPSRQSKIC